LIATNGLLVTRFNATNDLLATRINGVTNGASAWTVSGTTTRLANTNTTNVVSYGILTTAGVASTASNGQAVASLVLTNAPYCWTNGTGRNVTVYLSRGVVNGITINGSVVATNSTGYFIDEVMTLSLQPNEWFSCSVSNDATTNLPLMTTKPFYGLVNEVLGFPWKQGLSLLPICLNLPPWGLTFWPYVPKLLGFGLLD
jgi:hypothetical protein